MPFLVIPSAKRATRRMGRFYSLADSTNRIRLPSRETAGEDSLTKPPVIGLRSPPAVSSAQRSRVSRNGVLEMVAMRRLPENHERVVEPGAIVQVQRTS